MTVLTPLEVSARLALAMTLDAQDIAARTGLGREALLAMIDRSRPFSRAVLRYLGLKKVYVEFDRYELD